LAALTAIFASVAAYFALFLVSVAAVSLLVLAVAQPLAYSMHRLDEWVAVVNSHFTRNVQIGASVKGVLHVGVAFFRAEGSLIRTTTFASIK